jgi:hypothetical protein
MVKRAMLAYALHNRKWPKAVENLSHGFFSSRRGMLLDFCALSSPNFFFVSTVFARWSKTITAYCQKRHCSRVDVVHRQILITLALQTIQVVGG